MNQNVLIPHWLQYVIFILAEFIMVLCKTRILIPLAVIFFIGALSTVFFLFLIANILHPAVAPALRYIKKRTEKNRHTTPGYRFSSA